MAFTRNVSRNANDKQRTEALVEYQFGWDAGVRTTEDGGNGRLTSNELRQFFGQQRLLRAKSFIALEQA
ncbi:MAG: hypothetical protein P8L31_06760 [Pseudomonadales bacterium]|nr:hypothetical protein [Pseudomonadales bacterium]